MNASDDAVIFRMLERIAHIRRLRDELAPILMSPVGRTISITQRQRTALFDLIYEIDRLFPGVPILRPEDETL